MIWWKGHNAKLHYLLPSLTQIIYMCLCMCMNMAVKCTERYMAMAISFVWRRFNSHSCLYSVLTLWVISPNAQAYNSTTVTKVVTKFNFFRDSLKLAILSRNLEYRILMKLLYFYCCAFVVINIVVSFSARSMESFKMATFLLLPASVLFHGLE